MHNCSCTADAEDVVQDVFEKLLRYEGRFESEEHLKAWLLRVAINRCRDITRASARRTPNWTKTFLPRNPEMTAVCSMRCALCRKTTATPCTSIITRGYTAAEVGRMLGAPTNTVLSWLRRARASYIRC